MCIFFLSDWLCKYAIFFLPKAKFSLFLAIDCQNRGFEWEWFPKCDAFNRMNVQTHDYFKVKLVHFSKMNATDCIKSAAKLFEHLR